MSVVLNFMSGVVASLLATAIAYIVSAIRSYSNSPYTGLWKSEMYNAQGKPVKHDEYLLRHNRRNGVIGGPIRRIDPDNETDKRWICKGIVDNDCILMVFCDLEQLQLSHGVCYVMHKGVRQYEGYYLGQEKETAGIVTVKIKAWKVRDLRIKDYFKIVFRRF